MNKYGSKVKFSEDLSIIIKIFNLCLFIISIGFATSWELDKLTQHQFFIRLGIICIISFISISILIINKYLLKRYLKRLQRHRYHCKHIRS